MEQIKVLAIIKKNDANRWHRLEYGLGKLNGLELESKELSIEFEEFNENTYEKAKNSNIFIYEWDVSLTIQEIGNLQALGIKILYSISDYWEFGDNHPVYNNPFLVNYAQQRVLLHLMNADGVMVTCERLALHCMKYNDNIAIIPNFLNPEDFKINKIERKDKLRIGLVGSASHVSNWELLKGVINRIAKNKDLSSKIEFYIKGGLETDVNFKRIYNLFKSKKNLSYTFQNSVDVDSYINVYDNLDVVLMPLEYTEFNLCRSSLKLLECAMTNTLPIGSKYYSSKELKGIVVCETPLQYEETLTKLLEVDYYNKVLKYVTEINLKDNNWELRFKNMKSVLGALAFEDLAPKLPELKLYSITYKNDQIAEHTNYFNGSVKEKGWRFEYNPIIDIVSNKIDNEEYIGILSWKFNQKSGLTKNVLYKTLNKKNYKNYDFINLTRNHWKSANDYLQFSYKEHPKLKELLILVLNKLNIQYTEQLDNYTYSNFFIMKTELYKEYVSNWIIPALDYMENDIWKEVNVDANYKSGVNKEELMANSGVEFYNYVTFILERLPLFFIKEKQLKVLNIM